MPDILSNEDLNALAAEYVLGTLDYEERNGASALLEVDPTFRGIVRVWEKRFGELHLMVESVQPDPNLWERIRPKVAGVEQVSAAIPSDPAEPVVADIPVEPRPSLPGDVTAEPDASATAEVERQLAELAALQTPAPPAAEVPVQEPPAEDPEAKVAEPVARGFVPPPPMVRRSPSPVSDASPVRRSGRGWMATSLVMALVAVMLAGLISAWRFFPERLPPKLRVHTLLKIPVPPPPLPPPLPKPPAFDE